MKHTKTDNEADELSTLNLKTVKLRATVHIDYAGSDWLSVGQTIYIYESEDDTDSICEWSEPM